jgi:hypothetical protein
VDDEAGRPWRPSDAIADDPTAPPSAESGLPPGAEGLAGQAVTAADRSPHPATCPFFRSLGPDGVLARPIEAPDPINRCAASGEVKPQSYRQQELVCLTGGHVNCPRYLRGLVVVRNRPFMRPRATTRTGRATGAAVALLATSVVASVGFVFARGGLTLPVAGPSGTSAAVASPVTSATPVESAAASLPAVSPSSTPEPSPVPSTAPSPSASARPSLPPTPRRTPSPAPRSDRYDLLDPCPDSPDCWIYTVRSGDNLTSIANYFGIPLETVRDLNPWTRSQGLRAGQELILPPPTR